MVYPVFARKMLDQYINPDVHTTNILVEAELTAIKNIKHPCRALTLLGE